MKYISIDSQVKKDITYSMFRNNNVIQKLKFSNKKIIMIILKIMHLKGLGNHGNLEQSKKKVNHLSSKELLIVQI